jgi:chemotaxis protein histidine kinase CheA
MSYRDEFNDTEELIHTFTTEGQELLDEVEPRLIELKDKTGDGGIDAEVLNSIFRIFHTIKGSAGFLELNNLQEVTHEAETLLDHYRKGLLTPSAEQIGLLLSTTDFIRKLMGNIEKYLHDKGFEPEAHTLVEALARVSLEQKNEKEQPREVQETPAEKTAQGASADSSPEDPYQLVITSEMLAQYSQESLDLIDGLEQAVLDMENTPDDHELIDRAFRALHTLKGNSGLVGLADMERLSHRTESLFDYMRKGTIRPEMENIKMVLSIIDLLRSTVTDLAKGGDGKIRGCDVLVTATPSDRPIVKDEWVHEGMHLNCVGSYAAGKQEIEPGILKRATVVVDDWEQASHAGEINVPVTLGDFSRSDVYAELPEIAAGVKPGRTDDAEVTVFDTTGLAIQDVVTAWKAFEVAERTGRGVLIEPLFTVS